jgi:peptidoglycan hydrolase-like protein with peptidoglycan-binding domain
MAVKKNGRHWLLVVSLAVLGALPVTYPAAPAKAGDAPMEPVGSSANRNLVRAAQQALAQQGYRPGAIDGWMGRQTSRAIAEFQRARSLSATGDLDEPTVRALGLGSGR